MAAGSHDEAPAPREAGAKTLYSAEHTRLVALLRAVRREAGLTQLEVARRLGRPMDYVSRMEGGQQRVDVVEWLRLLRVIGTDPVAFLGRLADAFEPPLTLGSPTLPPQPSPSLPDRSRRRLPTPPAPEPE